MNTRRPVKSPAIDQIAPDAKNPIGHFIRERRKLAQLSQLELCELADIEPRALWDLERGEGTLPLDAANRVLAVFGKTLGPVDAPEEASASSPRPRLVAARAIRVVSQASTMCEALPPELAVNALQGM